MKKFMLGFLIVLASAVMCGAYFQLGYTKGWNDAPPPTTEYLEIPVEVVVEKKWDHTLQIGIDLKGDLVESPESEEGLLYLITVRGMADGGYSQAILFIALGEQTATLQLGIRSYEFDVKVKAIVGAVYEPQESAPVDPEEPMEPAEPESTPDGAKEEDF